MTDNDADSFNYLAFDDESWELLAHGETASRAKKAAEEVAPYTEIKVVHAAPFGRTIWDRGVQLYLAERALQRARQALEELRPGKLRPQAARKLN